MVDWPGFYPKEKLKKLPRIRELLKLDPISCLEEEQRLQESMIIENLEDDIKIDAKNGDTTEEIISTDEEMTEIEPNNIKLIDDKSYLETEDLEPLVPAEKRIKLENNDSPKLDLEALVSKFIYSLRECEPLTDILIQIEDLNPEERKQFEQSLIKDMIGSYLEKIGEACTRWRILEEHVFLTLLQLLQQLVEKIEYIPADVEEVYRSLITFYPQLTDCILDSIFTLTRGSDILEALIKSKEFSKDEIIAGLIYIYRDRELTAAHTGIVECMLHGSLNPGPQLDLLIFTIFQAINRNKSSSKCLTTSKFSLSILARVEKLNTNASVQLEIYIKQNKTFLRSKLLKQYEKLRAETESEIQVQPLEANTIEL